MRNMLKNMLATAVIGMAMLWASPGAFAADKVTLKDGRVIEGTITREVDGSVWIKTKNGAVEREEFFVGGLIEKIERDAASEPATAEKAPEAAKSATTAAAAPKVGVDAKKDPVAIKPGVPRIAVITLGEGSGKDMVGIYMTASVLEEAIPLLEAEGVTDVVMRINSGGGMLLEIQKLSDVIHNEYKPKFRTVAWIESAISAAAMTAHCLEEIYFMPSAQYGACTGWYGALVAVEGRDLEDALYMMEKISARGKHDPYIMRSMQVEDPLSATVDDSGDVHWFKSADGGEEIVNPAGRILTFNAEQAEKFKFSRGTAATIEDVARLMGYKEYELVGVKKPGVAYPISKAEERQRRYRDQCAEDEKRWGEYVTTLRRAVETASGVPREERGKFVGQARKALDNIKKMVNNNPNFSLLRINIFPEKFPEWYAERDKELRDLMR